jgi:cytochrome c peroxidase
MYQKFGLMGDYWTETGSEHVDEGRFKVTNNEVDKYMFKVPSLRNVEKTYPYFHDGSVSDLKEAIVIMGKVQLNREYTDKELNDMVAFLKTLTGEVPEKFAQAPAM